MFEHSVKVPRPYKVAANIFKKVVTEGGSVKTLLYDNKLRHFRTNALYALITETIKHSNNIDKIFEECKILVNEPRLDPWLAKVLTTELLFGKQFLPGKSKPEQIVSSYKEQFDQYTAAHQENLKIITEAVRRPRYVRINTNLLTTSDAVRSFQEEGYNFIRCTSGTYNDYLKQVQSITENDFTQDYHVKTVYVFPPGTKLHEHELYLESKIILQDKATAMAVHLLAPPQGSVIMDMCAAPGMKTSQLAAYIRNEGKIYAVERSENRYKTLCDFVESTDSKCVETIHKDALAIKRGDFDDVEYILLDPSCSGSGMDFSVHNYIEPARLAKLTSLQEKFLKHAMNAFPKAKRIVYSTCSLNHEENERVVTNTVKVSRAKWRVQNVKELLKGHWNNFGSNMYGSIGERCMYARPESDMTTGFFLAVLDRDQKDWDKCQENYKTGYRNDIDINEVNQNDGDDVKKLHKKKKKDFDKVDDITITSSEVVREVDDANRKKNRKKKHSDRTHDIVYPDNNLADVSESHSNKKSRKDYISNEVIHEETNASEIESLDIKSYEKVKKSHKKKNKDSDETDDKSIGISEIDNNLDNTERKKKKKRLNESTITLSSNDDPTNNGENHDNKCTDTTKIQEFVCWNNDLADDRSESSSKKKSRKKDHFSKDFLQETNALEIEFHESNMEMVKQNKRKNQRISECLHENDASKETDSPKKKKTQKKHKNMYL